MTPQHSDVPSDVLAPTSDGEDGFDIREFARTARGNHRSELQLDDIRQAKIGLDAVKLVRTLRDLERTTMQRMRNLLVTATHKDARITAFLTTWAFEKFWIADALDAVLDANGQTLAGEFEGPTRKSLSERIERRGPVVRALVGNFAGPELVSAHITTQLVDEWIGQTAYRKLAEAAAALGSVVDMVLAVKDRHVRFFTEEAQRRLAASARARKLTRKELDRMAWPVGATELSDNERSFFESFVFGGGEGLAEANRISVLLATLPGMACVTPTVAARLVP